MTTKSVLTSQEKLYSMEEHWMWYLTGTIDAASTMTVKIQKDKRRKFGYNLTSKFYLTRPNNVKSIFGMIDEYLEGSTIEYQLKDLKHSNRLQIQNGEDIQTFLEPIVGGFIQQRDRAEYFLNEVIPSVEGKPPQSKREFIDVMEVIDELEEYPIQPRGGSKYDADYFREEWDLD